MNTKDTARKTNNERLKELVKGASLTQAVALTLFNRGLGPGAYSESAWKSFFCDPTSARYRPLKDELLEHAEKVFGKLQVAATSSRRRT